MKLIKGAKSPLILMGRVSRSEDGWADRIKLAEAMGARVFTGAGCAASFPSDHALHLGTFAYILRGRPLEELRASDLILALDWVDLGTLLTQAWPPGDAAPPPVINVTNDFHIHNGWSMDYQKVAAADVRVATVAAPPAGVADGERWFDVDLDEQVLVAYEGATPVYATLVSTGKRKHRTPTGITRIKAKLERATMNNDDGEVYSVADVPWTMYYADKGYALHTAYWHDGFGGPRSHGCVNLAPHDARVLYHWSSPDVPPGWVAVYGDENNPGSLVRVRSRKVPEPAFRGYARRMLDKERS